MKSFTKLDVSENNIIKIFNSAGFKDVTSIEPLTAGEFNSAYFVVADNEEYVLKISPTDDANVLTYEKDIMDKEVKFYNLIGEKTEVKIPKIYYTDFSKLIIPGNLFIMEKLKGMPLTAVKLSKQEKAEVKQKIGEITAKLHNIEGDKFGYIQNGLEDNWYKAIRKMTQNIINDCEAMGKTCKNGKKLIGYIDKNKTILEGVKSVCTHFDIWDGNVFYEKINGKIVLTLIDTERTFWGDGIGDFCSLGFLSPLNKKGDYLKGYNAIAKNPITYTKEEIIRYYILFAYLGLIVYAEKFVRYKKTESKYILNYFSSKIICSSSFRKINKLL